MAELSRELQQRGAFEEGVVVQAAVNGPLERTQAVFDRGRLVANHTYRQIAAGPRGGDVLKVSVRRPEARASVERIGAALDWHGALSFDHILEARTNTPLFLDANPRLVEPMNAWLSGVDLTGALLRVSLGETPAVQPDGREGVVTRLGLMGLMDAASQRGRRGDILRELTMLAAGTGRYRGSIEELVPLAIDPFCVLPLGFVLGRLLVSPASASEMSQRTIESYSLTPVAIERLRKWILGGSVAAAAWSPTQPRAAMPAGVIKAALACHRGMAKLAPAGGDGEGVSSTHIDTPASLPLSWLCATVPLYEG